MRGPGLKNKYFGRGHKALRFNDAYLRHVDCYEGATFKSIRGSESRYEQGTAHECVVNLASPCGRAIR